MSATDTHRQEIIVLTDEHKNRILDQIRHRKETCPHCGGKQFSVGYALYLGFLFRS
jgi:tRNA G26 N,N-dimethylase Trm1